MGRRNEGRGEVWEAQEGGSKYDRGIKASTKELLQ